MKLTLADRSLVYLISQAHPPAMNAALVPPPAALDWAEVIAQAQRHGLASLLFDAVKKTGRFGEIPPPVLMDLRRSYLRSANQNEENFRELVAVLDALGEARIPVVLLKGSALAVTLYDDIAQRPMCDLDLLIPKDALQPFIKILTGRGFDRDRSLGNEFNREFHSQMCFVRPDASGLTIEPHWHLFDTPYYAKKIPVDWFWRHTVPVEIRGRHAQMLSPKATLLHLAGHYYIQHQAVGLRPLFDIARVLAHGPDQIDGDELTAAARDFGLLFFVQSALRETTAIWQAPLPVNFSVEMDPAQGIPPAEVTSPSRYLHHVRDLMGVAGLKLRLVYLWKLIFPDREYLRQRYGMRDDRFAVFYYGYRIVRLAAGSCGMLVAFIRRKSEL